MREPLTEVARAMLGQPLTEELALAIQQGQRERDLLDTVLLDRHYRRLRETGLALFPDGALLLVEGESIRLNRAAAEAFSVALAEAPADPI